MSVMEQRVECVLARGLLNFLNNLAILSIFLCVEFKLGLPNPHLLRIQVERNKEKEDQCNGNIVILEKGPDVF